MQQTALAPPRRATRWAEPAAYVLLVAVALALRLIALGDRVFHHDESQDAYFSWLFFRTGDYEYQPILHGPLRFYLTSLAYLAGGPSDFTARLAPALMGTAIVVLPVLLRDQLGRVGALTTAAFLAFTPSYLYFSRFAREDIYIACITLALLVVVFRFLERPRRHQPALIGGLLAASFATKETTFITVFVAGTFFIVHTLREARAAGSLREAPIARTVASVGWEAWAWGLAAFAGVFTLLFTTFLTHPAGLWAGIYDGLAYWLGQQPVGRGGEPWFYYLVVLFAEEWPSLLLGGIGMVVALRRPTLLRAFLVWAFGLSLAVYSWASEKFAWLVLHPLLPLILLAGIGLQAMWASRDRLGGRIGLGVAIVGALYMGWTSFQANARHSADPRELLVSTQSSAEVKRVAQEVLRLDRRTPGRLSIAIDGDEGATFPWAWYFRDEAAGYVEDMGAPGYRPEAQVLIMTDASREALAPQLAGYRGRRFDFRDWWVKDYGRAFSPGNWWRWATRREPWNATGGLPEWIYVRADLPTRQTTVPSRSNTRRPILSNFATPSDP
jgi:uncharacterized protein (TIGR03663 family)